MKFLKTVLNLKYKPLRLIKVIIKLYISSITFFKKSTITFLTLSIIFPRKWYRAIAMVDGIFFFYIGAYECHETKRSQHLTCVCERRDGETLKKTRRDNLPKDIKLIINLWKKVSYFEKDSFWYDFKSLHFQTSSCAKSINGFMIPCFWWNVRIDAKWGR